MKSYGSYFTEDFTVERTPDEESQKNVEDDDCNLFQNPDGSMMTIDSKISKIDILPMLKKFLN